MGYQDGTYVYTDTTEYGALTDTSEYGAICDAPLEELIGSWPTFRHAYQSPPEP